jgi:hypothetical protein
VKKTMFALIAMSAMGMAAAPAMAQDAPSPAPEAPAAQAATAKAGDTIYDTAGEAVATVDSVDGSNVVISVGSKKATLPMSSLSSGPKGPVIGMTKQQLDTAIQNAGK